MSADQIIDCLEHLTDYRQFERLYSDVMAGPAIIALLPLQPLTNMRMRCDLPQCLPSQFTPLTGLPLSLLP